MLLTLVLLVAIWITVMRHPDTPVAKAVWHLTVTKPIEWANRVRSGHLLLTLMLTAAVTFAVYWIGRESAPLFAMGAPDIGMWLVSFDIATYVDALVAVTLAASAIRIRGTWSRLRVRLPMRRGFMAKRERTTRGRTARRIVSSNDDDERWAWAA